MKNRESLYGKYCRPKLDDLLRCLKLDREYVRASGDFLFCQEDGREAAVVDFVGGFGTTLLGHNNAELKAEAVRLIQADTPFAAQVAVRGPSAHLAEKLGSLLPGKSKYYASFSNSGAESVEAAIKHAYKVKIDAARRTCASISRQLSDFCHSLEDGARDVVLPDSAAGKPPRRFHDDLDEHNLAQLEELRNNPVVCALKGSFHGKTVSALKLTFNKTYREGFEGLSSIRPVFIDPLHPEGLEEIVRSRCADFLRPVIHGNHVEIERVMVPRVIALILEVIQGEGGIRVIADEILAKLAAIHEDARIPFIVDEIQTGCGRTGTFYAFAQTPLARIEPEYVLLSKALGGSLSKTAVTLIRSDIYDPDFGILHTSTFAEDELSCALALKTVNMLTRKRNALMKEITRKGNFIMEKLDALRVKYPRIVREVRGRGLMIALEFAPLDDFSPFFNYAARQGLLSLLVASYLLNRHRIRVFAPLSTMIRGDPADSRASIIRVEPSAFIAEKEVQKLVIALDEACRIIAANNEYCLVAHLVDGQLSNAERTAPAEMVAARGLLDRRTDFDARTGFIIHPTSVEHLVDYYFPSFRKYRYLAAGFETWWNRISRFLEPDLVNVSYITSGGFTVENNMVVVPYLPGCLAEAMGAQRRKGDQASVLRLPEIRDRIQEAVTLAKEIGDDRVPTSMVGLGAHTSIVTDRGRALNDYEVPLTTGNAYTAALMFMGIRKAAELQGIDISTSKAAVVGGAGNIGTVIAALLCQCAGEVRIIGRGGGGIERLKAARAQCLRELLHAIALEVAEGIHFEHTRISGLGRNIYQTVIIPSLVGNLADVRQISDETIARLDLAVTGLYGKEDGAPISLHADLEAIRDCEIVAIATNSPDKNLVGPRNAKKGAIICCASVPSNLSAVFKKHMDDYFVFDGGFARLPEESHIDCVGMPGGTLAYGCLSETLLLAFEGRNRSFARGPLTVAQVQETIRLAERYGFTLGEFKLDGKVRRTCSRRIRSRAPGSIVRQGGLLQDVVVAGPCDVPPAGGHDVQDPPGSEKKPF